MDGFVKSEWKGFRDEHGDANGKESLYGEESISFPIALST
jgi:hypothetical protein